MSHLGPPIEYETSNDPLFRMRAYRIAVDLLVESFSGKDRARFFEFALGSVRESINWYQAARPVLGDVVRTRLNTLEELRRLLLAIIPRERERKSPIRKK